MGHIRLGTLPSSRKWRQVIALLEKGADTPQVAAATLDASQRGLKLAAKDEGLIQSFWLLTQIASAAQGKNFLADLRKAGLSVSKTPSLLEISSAFTQALDSHLRHAQRKTDVGEMAHLAATETMTALVGEETRSLFGTTADDVQRAFKKFSTTKQFGGLAREFVSRFTQRYLTYFLSRELSNHVGGNKRFDNISDHAEFNRALSAHCREASEIVETFSGGWFSKTRFNEKQISPENAAAYVHVALKKLRAELEKRGEAGG